MDFARTRRMLGGDELGVFTNFGDMAPATVQEVFALVCLSTADPHQSRPYTG